MNVSQNAYFTSEFLQDRRNRSVHRIPPSVQAPYRHSNVQERVPANEPRHHSPDVIARCNGPDELSEEITPAQLNWLPKPRNRKSSSTDYTEYYGDRPQRKSHNRGVSSKEDSSVYEPSLPPQTAYSGYYIDQKKRYDSSEQYRPAMYTHKTFRDVFNKEDEPRLNPMDVVFDDPEKDQQLETKQKISRAVRVVSRKMGLNGYNSYDYYMQQAREEEVKRQKERATATQAKKEARKATKHASNEEARPETCNEAPKETSNEIQVNEDKPAEQKTPSGKGSKLFRHKKKRQQQQKQEGDRDIFVGHVDSSDDDTSESDEAVTNSHPPNIKKQLRRKWRHAKKSLGVNYFDNYKKELYEREQLKRAKRGLPIVPPDYIENGESDQVSYQLSSADSSSATTGPSENFNPVWNYVLSWLVYNKDDSESQTQSDKIYEVNDDNVPVPKSDLGASSKQNVRKKLPKLPVSATSMKTYKELFQNWNEPASAYLAGQRRGDARRNHYANQPPYDVVSTTETEFSVEMPSEHDMDVYDGQQVNDEVVFTRGQVQPYVRESKGTYSSLLLQKGTTLGGLHEGSPSTIVSNINRLIKNIKIMKILFAPIDVIAENFPRMQTIVILIELVIFVWILYELSLLIDALCMAVRAVCAPMIAVGKFMNRIV